MEQLDDEPEHLDTVVAFPTDFTVGGLPADRKNIYIKGVIFKSVRRFKIKWRIPKDSHPEGAHCAFMEKNMNEPWRSVQKENARAAPSLETRFLNPHYFEVEIPQSLIYTMIYFKPALNNS